MSIIRAAIRQCAVAALRTDMNNWLEDRVYDSNNEPLIDGLTVGDAAKPYIVVFTDTDNEIDVTDGIYSATRNMQLVIEIAVASAVLLPDKEGDGPVINIPYTDPAMELLIDLLEARALASVIGDPRSVWGELIRLMVTRIVRLNSPRGGRTEKSTRYASRQIVLTLDTIADPVPGMTMTADHPLQRFLVTAEQLQPKGVIDAAHILSSWITNVPIPKWQQDQAWLGLTKRGIRAIGQAPLAETPEPGATPWATEDGADITDAAGEGPDATQIGVNDEDTEETTVVVPATENDASV